MVNECLNCKKEIDGNFCSNCSQATSTHRLSLSYVFKHDFIHGIFHFDKGFFYTIKELFTRPGNSIREYVQGKRTKHFNYFATILLLLTLGYFLKKFTLLETSALYDDKKLVTGLFKILKDYSKIVFFLHIPIIAFASYILFKKSKQNYTENLVLNLYLSCGVLAISLVLLIFMIFTDNKDFLFVVNSFLTLLTFLYVAIFYYQYFSKFGWKKYDLVIRIIIIAIFYMITKQTINNILNIIGLKYFN